MTEKAKADNKYFQAMRAKEAIDAECKIAQRSVEKQLKLLERAQEVEKSLNGQIVCQPLWILLTVGRARKGLDGIEERCYGLADGIGNGYIGKDPIRTSV